MVLLALELKRISKVHKYKICNLQDTDTLEAKIHQVLSQSWLIFQGVKLLKMEKR